MIETICVLTFFIGILIESLYRHITLTKRLKELLIERNIKDWDMDQFNRFDTDFNQKCLDRKIHRIIHEMSNFI